MGKVRGILLYSDCESHGEVTPRLHSFKTWAIEHLSEVCKARGFTSLAGVFKCLTPISDGKR